MPAIEPRVGNGRLAAMMEVYAPNLAALGKACRRTLDVAASENGEADDDVADAGRGRERRRRSACCQATLNTAALPPGRYLARATVTQGGKPQGHIVRPFRVAAGASGGGRGAGACTPIGAAGRARCGRCSPNLPVVDRKALLDARRC